MPTHKKYVPLTLAVLLLSISFGIAVFTSMELNFELWIGATLVVLSLILIRVNMKLYVISFGICLLLGLLQLLDFSIVHFYIGIGYFEVNPLFLILLIVYFFVHREELAALIKKPENEEFKPKSEVTQNERIAKFERKFGNKSLSELQKIADSSGMYGDEAIIAAKNILAEKKQTQKNP